MAVQTIVVAGPTGVIGRHLIPLLLSAKDFRIVALARDAPKTHRLFGAGVTVIERDLLNPAHEIDSAMRNADIAIHIATKVPADRSAPGAWDDHRRLRTEFTARFVDAAVRQRVSYLICQSIEMAYPDSGDALIDESVPLDTSPERQGTAGPAREMERIIRSIPESGPRWTILRGGMFVGKGTDEDQRIDSLREGTETLPVNPEAYQSMVTPSGFAEAIALCIQKKPDNRIYNVNSTPLRYSDYIRRLASNNALAFPSAVDGRKRLHAFRCDASRCIRELGWHPPEGSSGGHSVPEC